MENTEKGKLTKIGIDIIVPPHVSGKISQSARASRQLLRSQKDYTRSPPIRDYNNRPIEKKRFHLNMHYKHA
jgi:hypothetical protein